MEHHDQQTSGTLMGLLINGFRVSQAIHVAVTLGIADLLRAGPRGCDDLAAATGAHPRSLYRLLRALASVGVFREETERRFALTPLGDCLRSDAPESLGPYAAFIGQAYYWQAWGDLLHSIQTGEVAFHHVHGMTPWEYRTRHLEEGAVFDRAMTGLSRGVTETVVEAYDFGRFGCVVDVGGGHGGFLAALLATHPEMRGVLFDQPHVVAGAPAVLQAAGVADRCQISAGSFFEAIPEGGDAYILKSVLIDWEDREALTILRTCRRAIGPHGTVVVIEPTIAPPNEGAIGKFTDLAMLVSPGGQGRSRDDYASLFAAAGFRLEGVTPTSVGVSVTIAMPTL